MAWTRFLHFLPFFTPQKPFLPNNGNRSDSKSFIHRHAFVAHPSLPQSFTAGNLDQRPPQVLFNDVLIPGAELNALSPDYTAAGKEPHSLRTRTQRIHKPRDQNQHQLARKRSFYKSESAILDWDEVETNVPDTDDRPTLVELAMITGDAYALPGDKSWYDLEGRWNKSVPFGWDDKSDGLRGNIFVSDDNSTVILSIKGTSLYGQGPTSGKDKRNDNLLFSCCCARVDYSWAFSTVCNCFSGGWACGEACLEQSLQDDDLFYNVAINLYNNVTYMYPNSQIWITGHSLGGGISALLGATFGAPTVAFEAPGERLAAKRLHLPFPPPTSEQDSTGALEPYALHPITHVYHTADPVPQGACTGVRSLCAKGGYALENRCHLGKSIVYDTITRYGWSLNLVKYHPIASVIAKVLKDDWDDDRQVPMAEPELDCIDCFKWEYLADQA